MIPERRDIRRAALVLSADLFADDGVTDQRYDQTGEDPAPHGNVPDIEAPNIDPHLIGCLADFLIEIDHD